MQAERRRIELECMLLDTIIADIRNLAFIVWSAARSLVMSLTLRVTCQAIAGTFAQGLQRTLEETTSSSEELRSQMQLAVIWKVKAGEILKAHAESHERASALDHRSTFPRRAETLEALRQGEFLLTTTIERLQGQLVKTKTLQTKLERQTLEFHELDNAEYQTSGQKLVRFWRWLVHQVQIRV